MGNVKEDDKAVKFFLVKILKKNYMTYYSLNSNQSKSTDYQWNLTNSNSWKEVTVNQSNFTDYLSENWLL